MGQHTGPGARRTRLARGGGRTPGVPKCLFVPGPLGPDQAPLDRNFIFIRFAFLPRDIRQRGTLLAEDRARGLLNGRRDLRRVPLDEEITQARGGRPAA